MEFEALRQQTIERQLAAREIAGERDLRAMAESPSGQFLPRELAEFACQDSVLPVDQQGLSYDRCWWHAWQRPRRPAKVMSSGTSERATGMRPPCSAPSLRICGGERG